MKEVTSPDDLYAYLLELEQRFRRDGHDALAEALRFARGEGASSGAEFYFESRNALRKVVAAASVANLTGSEQDDVRGVIRQLDSLFDAE